MEMASPRSGQQRAQQKLKQQQMVIIIKAAGRPGMPAADPGWGRNQLQSEFLTEPSGRSVAVCFVAHVCTPHSRVYPTLPCLPPYSHVCTPIPSCVYPHTLIRVPHTLMCVPCTLVCTPILSCVYPTLSCVYPMLSCVYPTLCLVVFPSSVYRRLQVLAVLCDYY